MSGSRSFLQLRQQRARLAAAPARRNDVEAATAAASVVAHWHRQSRGATAGALAADTVDGCVREFLASARGGLVFNLNYQLNYKKKYRYSR